MQNMINPTFLLAMPGGSEMILIVVVVLLLFGGKKIPELMKGIGKGMREFKDAKESVTSEFEKGMQSDGKTTITNVPPQQ